MNILTTIRDTFWGTPDAPADPWRGYPCHAWVTTIDGLQVLQGRRVHWFGGRGKPVSAVCLHCGALSPAAVRNARGAAAEQVEAQS